jgi:hypothetical protein
MMVTFTSPAGTSKPILVQAANKVIQKYQTASYQTILGAEASANTLRSEE